MANHYTAEAPNPLTQKWKTPGQLRRPKGDKLTPDYRHSAMTTYLPARPRATKQSTEDQYAIGQHQYGSQLTLIRA